MFDPVLVCVCTDMCPHCQNMNWQEIEDAVKTDFPHIQTIIIDNKDFTFSNVPENFRKYTRWVPMICLFSKAVWNEVLNNENFELVDGIFVFNGTVNVETNQIRHTIIEERSFEHTPEGIISWIDYLKREHFMRAKSAIE